MNSPDKVDTTGAEESASADIAAFDTIAGSEQGAKMEVKNPKTGEVLRHEDGRPFTITYRGLDSETYRTFSRAQQDRRIQASFRTRTPTLAAVSEKESLELMVTMTLEWDIVLGGRVPPSNSREYRDAYTKFPWLKRQGDEFIGVEANFIKD